MYEKILLPLDGSALSAGILPYARLLARLLILPVELVYVADSARLGAYSPRLGNGDFLREIAATFPEGVSVKPTVEHGNPADVIINLASAHAGTLVTMSTRGYAGAARWLLGSVADKVLHGLKGDVLMMRPDASGAATVELKTILVPLDGSQAAEKVLPPVSELATLLNLEMLLVHVTKHFYAGPPESFAPVFGAVANLKELWERDKAEGNRYLKAKADQLRERGLNCFSTRVIEAGVDGAAGEIVDLAQKIPGSLIAMTRHGDSRLSQWLVGSVTKRVVQHSRRPVLVVQAQSYETAAPE